MWKDDIINGYVKICNDYVKTCNSYAKMCDDSNKICNKYFRLSILMMIIIVELFVTALIQGN
jgi:hypothetical protein